MSRPTPSQRLLTRLAAMGVPIEDGATIVRTYVGYWQRRQGAWIWMVESAERGLPKKMVGSHSRVTDLVRGRLVATWDDITQGWTIEPYVEGANYDLRKYGVTTMIEQDR
jgi:hypothetical protein